MRTRTGTRSIALLLAVVMAAVCLAGCSNNFKSKKVVELAKDYGMRELTREEFDWRWQGGWYNPEMMEVFDKMLNAPAYYAAKDGAEADQIYDKYFKLDTNDVPGLEEFIECEDRNNGFDIFLMTCSTKESAERLYNEWAKYWGEDEDTTGYTGTKSGCTYTILHYEMVGDTGRYGTRYFGMYLKGNVFIYIDTVVTEKYNHDCLDHFCKKLGLVSPIEPKK